MKSLSLAAAALVASIPAPAAAIPVEDVPSMSMTLDPNPHPICSSGATCNGRFDMRNCIIDSERLLDKGAAVRFKDFGERYWADLYVGAGDVGNGQCRAGQKALNYDHGGKAMPFHIQFDPATETMATRIGLSNGSKGASRQIDDLRNDPGCTVGPYTLTQRAVPPAKWDGITFTIANRKDGGGDIWITDVEVNGIKLGNMCGPADSGFSFQNLLPDYDLSQQETVITGNIVLCGDKSDYDNNENDKFEVLFLDTSADRNTECPTGPTPSDNDCPAEQVKLLTVNNEPVQGNGGYNDLPVQVISVDDTDPVTPMVTFQVCNTAAGGDVWTSYNVDYGHQCMQHTQSGPNTDCQTYTACCRHNQQLTIVDLYFENNGLGFPNTYEVPECCESPDASSVTKVSLEVLCYCPETAARQLLRGGAIN